MQAHKFITFITLELSKPTYFIIDFDSTFTQVEALDELCEISLNGSAEKGEAKQLRGRQLYAGDFGRGELDRRQPPARLGG